MTDILTPPDDPKERERFWREMRKLERQGMLLTGRTISRKASPEGQTAASTTTAARSNRRARTRK